MKELQQQIAELVEAADGVTIYAEEGCLEHWCNETCKVCEVLDRLRRALEPFNTQPKA